MKRPNFFIVGAPKCGTSSLTRYLTQHPDIAMATEQEPHFFSTDLTYTAIARRYSWDDYLGLFAETGAARCLGEKTPFYLLSKVAAANIREACPEARIIIMLRNPVDMMHSLHSHLLYNGDEDISSFEAALEAEADRRQGRRLSTFVPFHEIVFYRAIAAYTDQVQRYFDVFGRERVLVIIFDDLKRDPKEEYLRTIRFLGVEANGLPEFTIVNANKRRRSRLFRTVQRHVIPSLPGPVRGLVHRLMSPEARRRLLRTVNRWNTVNQPRPPMAPATRARLQTEFRDEIERLSALLDRDLTHWSKPDAHPLH